MKKLISAALLLILLISLAVPAFAADVDDPRRVIYSPDNDIVIVTPAPINPTPNADVDDPR